MPRPSIVNQMNLSQLGSTALYLFVLARPAPCPPWRLGVPDHAMHVTPPGRGSRWHRAPVGAPWSKRYLHFGDTSSFLNALTLPQVPVRPRLIPDSGALEHFVIGNAEGSHPSFPSTWSRTRGSAGGRHSIAAVEVDQVSETSKMLSSLSPLTGGPISDGPPG